MKRTATSLFIAMVFKIALPSSCMALGESSVTALPTVSLITHVYAHVESLRGPVDIGTMRALQQYLGPGGVQTVTPPIFSHKEDMTIIVAHPEGAEHPKMAILDQEGELHTPSATSNQAQHLYAGQLASAVAERLEIFQGFLQIGKSIYQDDVDPNVLIDGMHDGFDLARPPDHGWWYSGKPTTQLRATLLAEKDDDFHVKDRYDSARLHLPDAAYLLEHGQQLRPAIPLAHTDGSFSGTMTKPVKPTP